MSDSTEQLICDLSRELSPVRRLARLGTIAALVVSTAGAAILAHFGIAAAIGHPVLKPDLRLADLLGLAGHLAFASGALAVALASCVPGRDSTERAGGWAVASGVALTLVAGGAIVATQGLFPIASGLFRGVAECTSIALASATLPAVVLTAFAGWGAPRRPVVTLFFGALAVVGFGTAPGQLGCPNDDTLHRVIGHLLAPLSGGLVLVWVMRLFYRPALPPIRSSRTGLREPQ